MEPATRQSRSVELFVRSLSPSEPPVAEHVEHVQELDGGGAVETATVSVWGREVGLSRTAERTDEGAYVLRRVADFRSWAEAEGVTMEPFFETRTVHSSVTGEEYAALRLPVCCLAEYEDGDPVHVAPYSTGDAICTVADRLGRLAEPPTAATADRPTASLRSR